MKILLSALAVVWLTSVGMQGAPSESSDREAFNRKMFSVVSLHNFGTSPREFAGLNDTQKQSLLRCRDALIALFRSADSNGDISMYMTPELRKQYKAGRDFVEPETSLEEIGILDWKFTGDESEIQLRFIVILSSEGDWVLSKNVATFRKSTANWRVSKLALNEK